jgi:serine/threonine protein kinase
MPLSSNSQSDFHSNTVDEFEILLAQSKYYRIYKVRVGLQWMIRKEVRPEFKTDAFLNEILRKEFNIGLQCNHPNIPKFFFLKENENNYQLYLEFVEGTNLEELRNKAESDTFNAIDFASQLIETLVYLKKKGIVYGDLHPGNILFNQQDRKYYLIDFGFAFTKDFSEINGGREAYRNKQLSDEAKLIFSLEKIIVAFVKQSDRTDTSFAHRFSTFCLKNNFDSSLETAQEWMQNNTTSAFKKNNFRLALLILVLISAGIFRWIITQHYSNPNPVKNNTTVTIVRRADSPAQKLDEEALPLSTNSKYLKADHELDSFRFLFKFLSIKEKLDKQQLMSLRNKLILESDIKFKNYISTISDSDKIQSLQTRYNKHYYSDFLESQRWIDKSVEEESKTENK